MDNINVMIIFRVISLKSSEKEEVKQKWETFYDTAIRHGNLANCFLKIVVEHDFRLLTTKITGSPVFEKQSF